MPSTSPTASVQPAEASASRQTQVAGTLREWAVNGVLDPREKLSEAGLAEMLGVSRTPVRHALAVLVEEGVLQRAGGRGYRVRLYDKADVLAAVETRALIEGFAARRVAAKGLPASTLADLRECLEEGDAIFRDGGDDGGIDEQRYALMNARFHGLIVDADGTELVRDLRQVIDRVPFGGPSAIRFDRMAPADRGRHLQHAHWQHHYMVAAVLSGDGGRAEALFREHGELIKVSLALADGPWRHNEDRALPIAGRPAQSSGTGAPD